MQVLTCCHNCNFERKHYRNCCKIDTEQASSLTRRRTKYVVILFTEVPNNVKKRILRPVELSSKRLDLLQKSPFAFFTDLAKHNKHSNNVQQILCENKTNDV